MAAVESVAKHAPIEDLNEVARAVTSMSAEWPSGKLPTTRVRRRISRMIRSMGLFVRMLRQCSRGQDMYLSVSSKRHANRRDARRKDTVPRPSP